MNSPSVCTDVVVDDCERKYRAPALEKGLDILELLAREGVPMTTSQMASALGRSVSELFRMVLVLEYRGYIASSGEGRDGYTLSNKLFTLGISLGSARVLLDIAVPMMKELSREIGQSCHMVVASGDEVVVVARSESPMDIGFSVRVGYRRLITETNPGALLYGAATDAMQSYWLSRLSVHSRPEQLAQFTARAHRAHQQGWLQAPSDLVDGVIDVCVPIIGAQGVLACLVVPFINIRSSQANLADVIESLQQTTQKIADAFHD